MRRVIFSLLVLLTFSCDKTEQQVIPLREVYLEIDLTYRDKALKASQASKLFNKNTPGLLAVEKTGFGGVIVYHGINYTSGEPYYAFDAACPYEGKSNICVEVEADCVHAVCSVCGSKYEILTGLGNCVDGPGDKYLQSYAVYTNGSNLIVRNASR